ncbi:Ig-like domain repeat protein [Aquisphaera giovannonii]|nr:Ig-like domain repeat protein [Aquisphaera giovannonii]
MMAHRKSRDRAWSLKARKPVARPILEGLDERILLAVNPIVAENLLPGTPQDQWLVPGDGDPTIQGFTTDISVNHGQTVNFKVNDTAKAPYHIEIYRMGYYGGDGARLVTTIPATQVQDVVQPAPLTDPSTGMVDAGNWSVTASWAVPTTATSGIYFGDLVRDDTGGASMVYFVVRADESHSSLLFQTSDSTWEAYNYWGGNTLYYGNYSGTAGASMGAGRAYAVSYNRPLTLDGTSGGYGSYDSPLHGEFPMVYWLEENGYDVSYFTDVDSDRNGNLIQNHQAFLSVGHDEYWSAQQRANVQAALLSGVDLAFFSGNECYWKTRYSTSIDASAAPYRSLVCYKESWAGAPIDPLEPSTATSTWRDPQFASGGAGLPENALSGTMYMNDRTSNDLGVPLTVPSIYSGLRFWRNTSVANLQPGQTATLGQYIVGYEVDEDVDNGFRPAGLFDMSSTTFSTPSHVLDSSGTVVGPGTGNHSITLYRAASGALVFGAGTIQWDWGLANPLIDGNGSTVVPAIQQATVNLLADMGVQPATLQSGLVAASMSTDTSAPVSTITSPTPGAIFQNGTPVTITGTATDYGGGVVAAVEVSVDGGATWHRAAGLSNWSYTWSPNQNASVTIKTRAVDDSGNLETPSAGVTVSVQGPISIWSNSTVPGTPSQSDPNSVELGVKFRSDVAGFIDGLRFYKGSGNTGTHVGSLWTSSGTLLAQATFTSETASGWQQVLFSTPIAISANTTYVAAYLAPAGHYASDDGHFANKSVSNGPLHALADGTDGGNGVYVYSSTSAFPVDTYKSENYYVDVVFDTNSVDTTPPTVTGQTPAPGVTGVSMTTSVTATFSEPVTPGSIVFTLSGPGGAVAATLSYNAASNVATLTPGAALSPSTTYTAAVSGAMDAAGNVMTPTSWSFTTAATSSNNNVSIWGSSVTPSVASYPDPNPYELGVKFRSSLNGYITALRYYKGPGNTGTHVGHLWSSAGTLLATATFVNETSTGWQQVNLSQPVAIVANTTYVASYHTDSGGYAVDVGYFASGGASNGPLAALANGVDGGNGIFASGGTAFPSSTYNSNNYWVDVVFSQTLGLTSTSTALAASPATSTYGQSVTFTAAVSPASGSGTPTGTVTFMDGTTTLGTGALNAAGVASFAIGTLAAGMHSVTAVYGGDANYSGGTSTAVSQVVNQSATTTALTSSANPSAFGQSVTFTATVGAVAPGAGTPTGAVTFLDGATTLGTGALNAAGVAAFSISTLAAGTHSITAVYGGDGNFANSTATAVSQQVNQVAITATSTALAASPATSTYGQSVTFTAAVSPASGSGTPTGTVTFMDGTTTLGTGALNAAGVASFAIGTLAAGMHSVTAVYGGDGNFGVSTSAAVGQQVNPASTSITLSTAPRPSTYGQLVTFTATVGVISPGAGVPTGTLTFMDGGSTLGTGTLVGGTVSFTTAALAAGTHTVTAVYGGDGNFANSTSSSVSQVVNRSATTTALTSSASPSAFGQSVTFTATVGAVAPGAGTPTGTVTFMDGSTTLGTGTLNSTGVTTFTTTAALTVASHSIKAVYGGDVNFTTSTSATLSQRVNKAATTTVVVSSLSPSVFGQSVTFTATVGVVSPGAGTPTGTVTFKDGSTTLGTGTLSASGVATFTISTLAAGTHSIKATYGGDAAFATSTSVTLSQKVNKETTTTTLSSSANPSLVGQSVTFTATVTFADPLPGTPTGTVTFKDGSKTLGTGTLSASGVATFTISTLAAGTHSIKATYGGDAAFATSTSVTLSQKVNRALLVAGGPAPVAAASVAPLTQPILAPIVAEAISRWRAAGADAKSLAALGKVDVQIADLGGPLLGMAGDGVITIDQDAAGYGWFVDATPADDSEFKAEAEGPAQSHVDLLSVVAHELGHELGLDHDSGEDVMAPTLPVGVRRVPAAIPIARGTGAAPAATFAPITAPVPLVSAPGPRTQSVQAPPVSIPVKPTVAVASTANPQPGPTAGPGNSTAVLAGVSSVRFVDGVSLGLRSEVDQTYRVQTPAVDPQSLADGAFRITANKFVPGGTPSKRFGFRTS